MVIPNFVRQALAGVPITVYGDGQQSRCFTHVADVVRALVGLVDSERCYGQVFNVGNTSEITIGNLARQVKEMCQSKSEITFLAYEEAYEQGFEDMRRRVPDISKIEGAIGWKPTIALPQVLKDVIEHFRVD
jgi:UDP-glucose 4-epimerase